MMMALGVDGLVARNAPASLLVLNYHRLRPDGIRCGRFDDGVFDTDYTTFRRQMEWLKSATEVLDEDALVNGRFASLPARGKIYSAVTFDDGYIDCLTLVKPVLDQLGIRATFFIPVEMIESRRLGWWDIAAYLLKNSRFRSIRVDDQEFDLSPANVGHALKTTLSAFKLRSADQTEGLLAKLAEACGVAPPMKDAQSAELMTWEQVRELRASGHSIGSHAMSHRVLATLDPLVQKREIVDSKRELESILGCSIASFAYPVGGPQHYDEHSVAFVREAGYVQAFTYNTGTVTLPISDRFRIPRESARTLDILKAKARLPGVMGMRERLVV
jgi:peptidoglycan/xylan/chitin deacetylase (PgdA/CDA1 family)